MQVNELAKDNNIEETVILEALKSLKMKASGGDQKLSAGVLMILKKELDKKGVSIKLPEPPKPKVVKKKTTKKKTTKRKTAKKTTKKITKKTTKKETKRVSALTSTAEELEQMGLDEMPPELVENNKKSSEKSDEHALQNIDKDEVKSLDKENKVSKDAEKPIKKEDEGKYKKDNIAKDKDAVDDEDQEDLLKKKGVISKEKARKIEKERRRQMQAEKQIQSGLIDTEEDITPTTRPVPEMVSVTPLKKKMPIGVGGKKNKRKPTVLPSVDDLPKHEGPLKDIVLKMPITVSDLANKIGQKTSHVLKRLMAQGVFANINQSLEEDVVVKIAEQFGFNAIKEKSHEEAVLSFHESQDDPNDMQSRAPVITFMGHVDHGKTSLIDYLRETKVVDKEHGGITQHVGAYSVNVSRGSVTVLDTPGHAAFTAMRARGAHITDIVVVVIAADDGIMPQTKEAIDHARAGEVPIVIALNKIDLPNADQDKVKKQLMEMDLLPEDWGGKTIVCPVSAKTGEGIDDLLEMILLESEMLELKANPNKMASGIVVEAHLSQGKGAVASLIVQNGTLRQGDFIIAGNQYCRVKALLDDHERSILEAGPSTPVEILGLSHAPEAGERFYVVEDERKAREISERRQQKEREEQLQARSAVSLDDLHQLIEGGEMKELKIVLKADVQGSLEAVRESLEKLVSKNNEVALKFIHAGVGNVNVSDVVLAQASDALIIAFNVLVENNAERELNKTKVDVRKYSIIYDAVEEMRLALEGMLGADINRIFQAKVAVKQVFKLSSGVIAGCLVEQGKVKSKNKAEVVRNGEVVFTGKISSLKRYKDDAKEVPEGVECGIALEGFTEFEEGDTIEAFDEERIARKL